MMPIKTSRCLAALMTVLALAGCGKSGNDAKVVVKQYVVTSAVDCSDNAGLPYEDCTAIIEEAVDAHTKNAATYTSMKSCEKTEGAGKCERVDDTAYRPRLLAFQLTMSEPPVAAPLYPSKKDEAGFRNADNTVLTAENEAYTFTKSATHASEMFFGGKKKAAGVVNPF